MQSLPRPEVSLVTTDHDDLVVCVYGRQAEGGSKGAPEDAASVLSEAASEPRTDRVITIDFRFNTKTKKASDSLVLREAVKSVPAPLSSAMSGGASLLSPSLLSPSLSSLESMEIELAASDEGEGDTQVSVDLIPRDSIMRGAMTI